MFIKPTSNAKDGNIFDIHGVMEEALLYPTADDIPTPWDASISIEKGFVVLEGNMSPGGPGDKATCICRVPINYFTKYYELEVPDYDENEDFLEALEEAGWVEA